MLATYVTPRGAAPSDAFTPDDLHVRLAQMHAANARRWLARSKTRALCADAYGDLLLAAVDFAVARTHAEMVAQAVPRATLAAGVGQLMGELLEWSHELRVRCSVPLKAA